MIDYHSHILPGIDDGSRRSKESQTMLQMAKEQGVSHMVATPHFYADRTSLVKFLERREWSYGKIKALQEADESLPTVSLGAEVYYFPGIGSATDIEKLTIEGSALLLLEMPFAQWTKAMYQEVHDLIYKKNLRVILAHIERFHQFQKNKTIWDEIFHLPVIAQMNTGAFLPRSFLDRRSSKLCLKLLEEFDGKVLLGSDCHNTDSRKPNMKAGIEYIEKKCGASLCENMREYQKVYNPLI